MTDANVPAIELTPKQRRSAERKRLKMASLHTRLAWWGNPEREAHFQKSALIAECDRIRKAMAELDRMTPSTAWADDAKSLRQDRGGEFPPADDEGKPLMQRARGEERFYPPQYLTTSGHSFDVYVTAIKTGSSELLTEDGYNGARVSIYDLPISERRRIHRNTDQQSYDPKGDRLVTNVF